MGRRAARGGDAFGGPPGGVFGDVADDHPAAFPAKPRGRRRTDAGGAADYDRDLVGQTLQSHGS